MKSRPKGNPRILYARVDGIPARAGCPVLLLHGLGSSGEDWPFQRGVLRKRWGTIALDLRGHGRSGEARGPFTIEDMAADVAATLTQLEVDCVHVVGLSLGAAVALQFAVDHGERVRTLTLVNGFSRLRVRRGGWVAAAGRLALALVGPMDWLGWWVARSLFPHKEQRELRRQAAARIASNHRGSYLRTILALARFDLSQRLESVNIPALVVAGAEDPALPLAAKRALARQLPHGRFAVIAGSGHVTPVDRPLAFNRCLLAFLEEEERGEQWRHVDSGWAGTQAGG